MASIYTYNLNIEAKEGQSMKKVIEFAENVLKYGRDKYRENPSPLFADGIDVFSGEHYKWRLPGKKPTVLSNMACQQNLFRTLTALSNLTGDPKYKDAAKAAIKYNFDCFADSSGLLMWGGHRFIDLENLEKSGLEDKSYFHELKNALPYYDLMYEVNPEATTKFIKAFWNAHIYDWNNLLMGRHGVYGLEVGDVWDHEMTNPALFRESPGLSFINCGNDLIYSAATFYRLTGDERALKWAKHLAYQYVRARNPETGLGVYQFTQPKKVADTNDDNDTESRYGDRAKRQFAPELGDIALEANLLFDGNSWYGRYVHCENAIVEMQIAKDVGNAAEDFLKWSKEVLLAFAKYAYVPETNEIKPMFNDGKDLTGFVVQRDGYYGKKGRVLQRKKADAKFLVSYSRGFQYTGDEELWKTARYIGKGHGIGDLGSEPGINVNVNLGTECHDARVLFALTDLYWATSEESYLGLGKKIAGNIEKVHFNNGYFTSGPEYIYSQFDCIEPYSLLALEAALQNKPEAVPAFVDGKGYIDGEYEFPDGSITRIKDDVIFGMKRA